MNLFETDGKALQISLMPCSMTQAAFGHFRGRALPDFGESRHFFLFARLRCPVGDPGFQGGLDHWSQRFDGSFRMHRWLTEGIEGARDDPQRNFLDNVADGFAVGAHSFRLGAISSLVKSSSTLRNSGQSEATMASFSSVSASLGGE